MGQAITGSVVTNWSMQEQISSGVLANVNYPLPVTNTTNYSNAGTGAAQCDTIYAKQLTLAGAPTTLNLNAGLTDPAGNAIGFARVREFVVQVVTATAGDSVEVYAAASNGWTQLPPVANPLTAYPNGGIVALRDPQSSGSGVGMVVTSGSCEVVLNPGASIVVVNVLIAGGSAP